MAPFTKLSDNVVRDRRCGVEAEFSGNKLAYEKSCKMFVEESKVIAHRPLRSQDSQSNIRLNSQRMKSVLPFPTPDFGESFQLGKEVGRGSFGTVYKCIRKETGEEFACKVFDKLKWKGPYERCAILREIAIMQVLSGHPNITRLEAVFEDDETVHMVMDCCDGGELFERIAQRGRLSEPEAARCFRQLLDAVRHCHANGIMHRDLKPENILLSCTGVSSSSHGSSTRLSPDRSSGYEVKLADFGLGVYLAGRTFASSCVGSPMYVAPEVLSGLAYDHKADAWSLGVILFALLSGALPFVDEDEVQLSKKIRAGRLEMRFSPWPFISDEAKGLVRRLLTVDQNARVSTIDAINDPWLVQYCGPARPVNPKQYYHQVKNSVSPLQSAILASLLTAPSKTRSVSTRIPEVVNTSKDHFLVNPKSDAQGSVSDSQPLGSEGEKRMNTEGGDEMAAEEENFVDAMSDGESFRDIRLSHSARSKQDGGEDADFEVGSLSSYRTAFSWPMEVVPDFKHHKLRALKAQSKKVGAFFMSCFGCYGGAVLSQQLQKDASFYDQLECRDLSLEERRVGPACSNDNMEANDGICQGRKIGWGLRIGLGVSGWKELGGAVSSSAAGAVGSGCFQGLGCFSESVVEVS